MNSHCGSSGAFTVVVGRSGEDAENQLTVGTGTWAIIGAACSTTGASWASSGAIAARATGNLNFMKTKLSMNRNGNWHGEQRVLGDWQLQVEYRRQRELHQEQPFLQQQLELS